MSTSLEAEFELIDLQTPTPTPTPTASPRIEVTIDQPPAGQIYRIGPEPSMPQIKAHARVVGVTPDPTSTTTFTWNVNVHYDASQSPHGPHRMSNDNWPVGTTTGSTVLVIPSTAFNGKIRGGDLKLSARATVNGMQTIGEKTGYKILGPASGSPADTQIRQQLHTVLTNKTLRQIASLESGGHQFDHTGYPLWSRDNQGGVGVMQFTKGCPGGGPSWDDVWNWRVNTSDGKALFYSACKKGAVERLRLRVQRNVNALVNQPRARARPTPLPTMPITVPDLARNLGDLDQQFDGVTLDDQKHQFEQCVIRVYNGAAGYDFFTPNPPALHEFRIARYANNMPKLKPGTREAIWERVPVEERITQVCPPGEPRTCPGDHRRCSGDPCYVSDVLSAPDLPHP